MARLLARLLAQAGAAAPRPLHDSYFDTLAFDLGGLVRQGYLPAGDASAGGRVLRDAPGAN